MYIHISGTTLYTHTPPESYNVYNVLLFLVMDTELYRQLGVTRLWNKVRIHINTHAYDIDLFKEVEEGSLLIVDERTANSLIEAMVHAITSGSLKMVGVLPSLDKEAISSTATLLKMNLAICSFWAAGLIVVKPWTDSKEEGNIPFDDISFEAAEVNCAVTEMEALLQSTRGHRMLAIHMSGTVISKGPLSPASPSLKIAASRDM